MKLDNNIDKCIVFYDSSCGVCDNFIGILAKMDKNDYLRFAPLNGESSKKIGIKLANDPKKWSIIVFDKGQTYQQSNAIFKIFSYIPILSTASYFLKLFPNSLCDKCYEIFARWRYMVLLKKKNCHLNPLIREKYIP